MGDSGNPQSTVTVLVLKWSQYKEGNWPYCSEQEDAGAGEGAQERSWAQPAVCDLIPKVLGKDMLRFKSWPDHP